MQSALSPFEITQNDIWKKMEGNSMHVFTSINWRWNDTTIFILSPFMIFRLDTLSIGMIYPSCTVKMQSERASSLKHGYKQNMQLTSTVTSTRSTNDYVQRIIICVRVCASQRGDAGVCQIITCQGEHTYLRVPDKKRILCRTCAHIGDQSSKARHTELIQLTRSNCQNPWPRHKHC